MVSPEEAKTYHGPHGRGTLRALMIPPASVISLSEIGSSLLLKEGGGQVSVHAHDASHPVEPHTAPHPVFLSMLAGEARLRIDGSEQPVRAGEACVIPAHAVRALDGSGPFQFLLVLLKAADPRSTP
jgi:quercetin dioxygenase-like cupin family protein